MNTNTNFNTCVEAFEYRILDFVNIIKVLSGHPEDPKHNPYGQNYWKYDFINDCLHYSKKLSSLDDGVNSIDNKARREEFNDLLDCYSIRLDDTPGPDHFSCVSLTPNYVIFKRGNLK